MTTPILLTLSIALLSGLMLSRVVKLLGLPAVTAYLIAGVLIGPFLLGKLGIGFNDIDNKPHDYKILCDLALGFIAFAIGNEFRVSQLKKIGRQATVIGIFQALFTCIVVDIVLIAFSLIVGNDVFPLSAAIVLGAVATATAPAATLMVVKQYKAKGPLTDLLLPVVALDDAVGLVVFAVSFGIAKSIDTGVVDIVSMLVNPVLEVVLSIALGAVMGILFTVCERYFHSNSKRMAVSVAFVMATVAISGVSIHVGPVHIAFSSLLACMMLGTVFCNICDFSLELMDRVDRWTAPLFIIFFVISGAELDLTVFTSIGIVLVGIAYILARSAGKYFGAFSSAKVMGCDKNIVKYLGITLLPQAGVALGMAYTANEELGDMGSVILQITLFAVLIYELVGPLLTKISLMKAGEIIPDGHVSARDEAKKILEMLHLSGRHARHSAHIDRNVAIGGSKDESSADALKVDNSDNNEKDNK